MKAALPPPRPIPPTTTPSVSFTPAFTPAFTRAFALSLAAALAVGGCSAASTILARNPMTTDGGATLSAQRPPKSDTFQLAKDSYVRPESCAAPVADAIEVAVSDAEVCVTTARNEIVSSGADAAKSAKTDAVTLSNDDSTRTLALPAVGAPSEVTTCTAPGGEVVHVFRVAHRACTPNDGFVTSHTSSLVFDAGAVDEVKWQFDNGRARGDHV